MMFADTFDLALESLRVSRILGLFGPYVLLMGVAFFLLNGRDAPELRNRITIFTASLVIGLYLCTLWITLTFVHEPVHVRALTLYTLVPNPSVMMSVLKPAVLISGALCVHALLYIVSGLRAAPRNHRNHNATIMICIALLTACIPPAAVARYWNQTHNPRRMAEAYDAVQASHRRTDEITARWAEQHPDTWQFLLLRAHYLRDTGRAGEADRLIERIRNQPDFDLPPRLRGQLRNWPH